MVATGCRQTTGPATPGAFSTVSPLSPVNGQTPILGPFGGNTRVAPPSTGSFHGAAAAAPITQPPPQYGPLGAIQPSLSTQNFAGNASADFSNQPIGSGVQQATWTETTSNVPGTSPMDQPSFQPNSTGQPNGTGLRLGGMPVIDLTGAPNPPNYIPNNLAPSNFAPQPTTTSGYAPNPYPIQNFYPPNGSAQPTPMPAPQTPVIYQAPTISPPPSTNWSAPSDFVPDAGRIAASKRKPLPPPTGSSRVAPIQSVPPQDALPWRRPGTRY